MDHLTIGEFADRLSGVMSVVIREFAKRQTNELNKGKINVPQFLILNHLLHNNESNMKELSKVINLTCAAATGIVDRLVISNYVRRNFNPDDRRVIKIKITPKGKALINRIDEQRKQAVISLFQRVSEPDRKEYLRILTQIRDALKKEGQL